MNVAFFQQSVTTVLIALIDELRTNDEFAGKSAVLLMDNYSGRRKPEIRANVRESHAKVITFQTHTAQRFHALELSRFGIFNKKMRDWLPLAMTI
jgi:hypothetical protein